MHLRRHCLSTTVLAASISIGMSCAHAESLSDAVAYAYANNPGLQAQRAAVRAADENFVQAKAGYGLTISAQAGETNYAINREGSNAEAITRNRSLSATQPIYTGGRVRARVSEAEAQILAGREQLRRFEMDVILRVVSAYSGVQRDEQLLKIAQETVALLQRELNDTQAKFDVRTVTMTDLAQSRARLAQARTQLINAQEQLAASRGQYLSVVGQNPGQLEPLPALEQLPEAVDLAFDAAEANNPQLLAAQYNEQASRARIARAKANAMPSVTARADLQHTPYLPYQSKVYDDTQSASIIFSQPIFSAGQIQSAIRQAVEENNRDRLSVDDVRIQVVQSVSQVWERLNSLRQQIGTIEEEVRANQTAFLGVRAEERFALRSNIEILNAEAELNASQQNLARARAAEYVARVQLLAIIGTLSPKMLSTDVKLYDPKANFDRVKYSGMTPMDLPVIVIDSIGGVPVRKPRPVRHVETRPTGSQAQPTPQPPVTRPSVLELIDKEQASSRATASTKPN